MRLHFTLDDNPRQHLADVSVLFDDTDGLLKGLELRGFAVWVHPDRGLYLTTPSRPYDDGGHRRYYRYLRESSQKSFDVFRQTVFDAFIKQHPGVPEKAIAALTARGGPPMNGGVDAAEAFDGV